jgi:hypothetical protein
MDSWADEKFSPKPVHGREQRNEAVSQEEGSSSRLRKESFKGGILHLQRESLSWIAGGGGDAGVAELPGDDGDVYAFGAELGGVRVAEAVGMDARQARTLRSRSSA